MTTETTEVEEELCKTCNKPKSAHGGMVHRFRAADDPRSGLRPDDRAHQSRDRNDPGSQGSIGIALKGDPVLRVALIRKGLLTPEDLNEVEAELKASGLASAAPSPVGKS